MNSFNQPNIWQGMSLDQTNEFKQEMQKLMPVVELMKVKASPDSLMGLERDQKLRIMGYSKKQIEEMCKQKEMDSEQMMRNVMVEQERELRRLAKWSRDERKGENRAGASPRFEIGLEECGESKL